MNINTIIADSPVGPLAISESSGNIIEISFGFSIHCGIINETEVLKEAQTQLDEYFNCRRREFSLPLNPIGTDFQKRVWSALTRIPYGQSASYKDIAIDAGSPKGARAVGMANHVNPISIVIPCHRVIGANKELVGYGGGLDKKIFLLELENINFIE